MYVLICLVCGAVTAAAFSQAYSNDWDKKNAEKPAALSERPTQWAKEETSAVKKPRTFLHGDKRKGGMETFQK